MKKMMNKIRCCVRVLFAKRYAVFTAEERDGEDYGSFSVVNANAPFILYVVNRIQKSVKGQKEVCETVLNEIDNGQKND